MWLKDPKTKEESISLTLLVVSFIAVLVSGTFQVIGRLESTGPFTELLYSFVALYWGRRFTFGGKQFTSEKAEEIKEKVKENE